VIASDGIHEIDVTDDSNLVATAPLLLDDTWRIRQAADYDGVPSRGVYARRVATREDLRRIALALPQTATDNDGFSYAVAGKAIVWTWLERLHPKKARVPNPDVIAVRVADESEKELLIDMDPSIFFTEPHYHGYPAILIRLPRIDVPMLETMVANAWRLRAPKSLVTDELEQRGPPERTTRSG
jgi:hypothetical protein